MGSCPDTDIDPIVFFAIHGRVGESAWWARSARHNLHVYFLLFYDYFHFYLSYSFPRWSTMAYQMVVIEERYKNALSLPYYYALHRLHCRNQRLRRNAGRSTTMAGHFKTLAFPREAQVINQNRVSECQKAIWLLPTPQGMTTSSRSQNWRVLDRLARLNNGNQTYPSQWPYFGTAISGFQQDIIFSWVSVNKLSKKATQVPFKISRKWA